MITPLFNIFEEIATNLSQLMIDESVYPFEKKQVKKSKQSYYMLYLPAMVKELTLSSDIFTELDDEEVKPHLTFFQNQKESELYFSAYHLSHVLVSSTHPPILVREYFTRNDIHCKTEAWLYDLEKKEKGEKIALFEDPNNVHVMLEQTTDRIKDIIVELRRQQQVLIDELNPVREELSTQLEAFSRRWSDEKTVENRQIYLEKINEMLATLENLKRYSNDSKKIEAEIIIYRQYQESLGEIDFDLLAQIAVNRSPEETLIIKHNAVKRQLMFLEASLYNEQFSETHKCLQELEKQKKTKKFSSEERLEFRKLRTLAQESLSKYAMQCISSGDLLQLKAFTNYIPDVPAALLEEMLRRDDAEMLEYLMNIGLISPYVKINSDETLYNYVGRLKLKGCMFFLIKQGVHPILMMSTFFQQAFRPDGSINLHKFLLTTLSTIQFLCDVFQDMSPQDSAHLPLRFLEVLSDTLKKKTAELSEEHEHPAVEIELLEFFAELFSIFVVVFKLIPTERWTLIFSQHNSTKMKGILEQVEILTNLFLPEDVLFPLQIIQPFLAPVLETLQLISHKLQHISIKDKKLLEKALTSYILGGGHRMSTGSHSDISEFVNILGLSGPEVKNEIIQKFEKAWCYFDTAENNVLLQNFLGPIITRIIMMQMFNSILPMVQNLNFFSPNHQAHSASIMGLMQNLNFFSPNHQAQGSAVNFMSLFGDEAAEDTEEDPGAINPLNNP